MSLSFLAVGVVLAICYYNVIFNHPALHPHTEAILPIGLHSSLALLALLAHHLHTRLQTPIFVPAFSRILNNKGTHSAKIRRYGETPGWEVRRD